MTLSNAGDCLHYGLYHELLCEDTEEKDYHLTVFLVYFALIGYIDEKSMKQIMNMLLFYCKSDKDKDDLYNRVVNILYKCLGIHFRFRNREKLFAALNEIKIPQWVFQAVYDLRDLYPQLYLVDDNLYYLIEVNDRKYFRCINVHFAVDIKIFSHDISEDYSTSTFGGYGYNYTISNKYSEILGFLEEKNVFYLRFKYADWMYAEYHIDTQQEGLINKKCYGAIGRRYPVIEENGCLAVVMENDIKILKKIDRFEQYTIENDMIFVTPKIGMPLIFKPYYLSIDGQRCEITYKEAKSFLFEIMERDVPFLFSPYPFSSLSKQQNDMYDEEAIITLKYLNETVISEEIHERFKGARLYRAVIKILMKYLPEDIDVIDYFYMLADVSQKYEKNCYYCMLSKELIRKLGELHMAGRLEAVVEDIHSFRDMLLETAYWNDESIKYAEEEENENGRLGFFDIINDQVRTHSVSLEEAICIGCQLIPVGEPQPGIVFYNIETGVYEIQYVREIKHNELMDIYNKFELINVESRVVVDGSWYEKLRNALKR